MAVALILTKAADPRLKSAENGSLCLVVEHLSNGDDTRSNRCLELADHYTFVLCLLCLLIAGLIQHNAKKQYHLSERPRTQSP